MTEIYEGLRAMSGKLNHLDFDKAPAKSTACDALDEFARKWESKYAYAIKSWKDNWDELTAYFDYPLEIRRIIYTTNAIESRNSSIRKYTKTKTVFPDDQAAL